MEINQSKRQQNKERKKKALIDAAEMLFIKNGFDNTSIDDVAKQADLTKRTLYQYFISKEDLYLAVVLRAAKQLTATYEEAFAAGGTALEKIKRANQVYLKFYFEHGDQFLLLNYMPTNRQNCEASPHYPELAALDGVRIGHYLNLIEMGKRDGSINVALDVRKAVFFCFFAAHSMMYTVSSMGNEIWEMIGLEKNDFLQFSVELFSDALQ